MRDSTTPISTTKLRGSSRATAHTSATLDKELASRLRLSHALQISLEPADLLQTFYQHVQQALGVAGLTFTADAAALTLKMGRSCLHQCDYRLSTDEGCLGEIVFTRSKRFTDVELSMLEVLLASLVYPLRNALRYQAALRMSMLDPLTMVGNRAALDNALSRELQLAERHNHELSLLVIDADHFKRINDEYGHQCGDQMLCAIARGIESVCRGTDMVFRYGGEEFVVLLGKTSPEGAGVIAERIRRHIQDQSITYNGRVVATTVSIGVASRQSHGGEKVNNLFERADTALYQAKSNGRNCVINSGI